MPASLILRELVDRKQLKDIKKPSINLNEPRHEKTSFLHMRKQRRRSASW